MCRGPGRAVRENVRGPGLLQNQPVMPNLLRNPVRSVKIALEDPWSPGRTGISRLMTLD